MSKMSKIKVSVKEIFMISIILLNIISPFLFIQNGPTINDNLKGSNLIEGDLKSSSIQNPREGYAIICGVSDYPGEDSDLAYCDDDAEDIYDFVRDNYHIPDANIIKLIDSDVTISDISDSISIVSSQMDSNDVLFFSYSGHGGAILASSGTQSWNIETPTHNYANNLNLNFNYSSPGAEMMRVHFTRFETEYKYDGIIITDYEEPSITLDAYSGFYSAGWSDWVNTDNINLNFISDGDTVYWGFRVDMVEIGNYQDPYVIFPYDGLESGLNSVTLDAFLDEVPGQVVTVLDSCHSGGVGQNLAQTNRYVLTASENSEYSLEDSSNHNGVFTNQFLLSWNNSVDINNDGVISFEENYNEVYDATVSRSTSVGYTHHPQEFDGIAGELILEQNGKINSVTPSGDDQVLIEFALSGLGGGKLVLVYYDFEEKNIIRSEITENLENGANWQQRSFATGLPNQEISGITFKAIQSYQEFSEIDNESVELTDLDLSYSNDYDGDSLSDAYEFEIGFNFWDADWDNDELTDDIELEIGTDSLVADTDNDGMPDGWEYNNGINPLIDDADEDPDYDGLTNSEEYFYGTHPRSPDTDGDNYSDKEEIDRNTNPLSSMSNPLMRGVYITGGIVGILAISFIIIKRKYIKPSNTLPQRTVADSTWASPIYQDNAPSSDAFSSENFEKSFNTIPQNPNLKFCNNCGAPIVDGTFAFCVKCGNRLW